MSHAMSRVAATMILLGLGAVPASAQTTHVVRLIANAAKDDYRFEPATVTVKPNDVVVFRVATGAPHSVVFEGEGLSPGVRGAINSALPGRSGDLSSPLLTTVGKDYRMAVPQMPPGKYQFYCLPHRAYDMRGEMVVK
jgi:plastocyanin